MDLVRRVSLVASKSSHLSSSQKVQCKRTRVRNTTKYHGPICPTNGLNFLFLRTGEDGPQIRQGMYCGRENTKRFYGVVLLGQFYIISN